MLPDTNRHTIPIITSDGEELSTIIYTKRVILLSKEGK